MSSSCRSPDHSCHTAADTTADGQSTAGGEPDDALVAQTVEDTDYEHADRT